MRTSDKKRCLIALDAGGTMTDTFLVGEHGEFVLGKALTNHDTEALSYGSSVEDAASYWDMTGKEVHEKAISSIYTGTTMLNILLTQSGSKVGLLITRGMRDLPYVERGLTWLGLTYEEIPRQMLHEHTPPLVHPKLIREVTERISVGSYYMGHHYMPGTVIFPMKEEDVSRGVNELLDQGVEYIGILFLGAYANPAHELRAAQIAREIVAKRGLETPVSASCEICPLTRESQRLKTLLIQCYVTKVGSEQLFEVEQRAKGYGYKWDLLTLLSYGAVANIRHPRLVEAVVSGPTAGLLGGQAVAKALGNANLVCADLGGTSWDVGLVINNMLPVNKDPNFANHRLRIPMVDINSIGAGTGTAIRVEPKTKRITLGPDSAGSRIGTCYDYPEITVGDIDLVLGYLNPNYFLGGKVKVDRERALEALTERLAKPMGQDVYEASEKVLDLLHSDMTDCINSILSSRGLNPLEFNLIVYGGSGPMHMWGVDRRVKFGGILTAPWAAAFSAFGVATADYFHRYDKAVTCLIAPGMPDEYKIGMGMGLSMAWQELENRAYGEMEAEGISRDRVSFRYGVAASYIGQLHTWESAVPIGRVNTVQDVDTIVDAFEKTYATIYPAAARFPNGHQIAEVYLEAVVPRTKPDLARYPLKGKTPSKKAFKGDREAYMDGKWMPFNTWEMDLLEPGNRVDGPAVIEHPMTTLVVPPRNYVEMDEHKLVWFREK